MEKEPRIIALNSGVDELSSLNVIIQLLRFDALDKKEPIHFYINSPGGSIVSGLAIYDTINYISAPVYTYCYGIAASMGAFLLSCGEKGHRYILPNARVLIHQPLINIQSQLTTESLLRKQADRLKEMRDKLEGIIAENCGKDVETLHRDCERDNWMSAEEAKDYHLVDEIIQN